MVDPMDTPKLYHPDILALAQKSAHWHQDHNAQHIIKAYNPVCGDKFEIRLDVNGIIENMSFFGYGCIVSKASIELLCEMIAGKNLKTAVILMRDYLSALHAYDPPGIVDQRVQPFMVARKFPGRVQCVALGWEAMLRSELFLKL
jgi:nitrogen fixation NifU-like protein